ncbi:stage III sporulation protein AC [Salimicrobium halophilum]|uniref:Stage III sporulation protein AC n=1 Tax=Salimicrobium halophilum TaxID=86666 RepID=A0A1G8PUF2_9BACI|nr:stage III sporulation protein AC [Salimicrobium halophilum]SDI96062.1 stage III sporulation protein AC [Salimicrobium halophilum]
MIEETAILFQIAGIGVVVAMIHSILKQMGKEEIAQAVTLTGFIIVLFIVLQRLAMLFQEIRSVFLYQG